MNAGQRGLALLTCPLGQEDARPLSMAQLRLLRQRVLAAGQPQGDPLRDVTERDLIKLGYGLDEAARIFGLLAREAVLDRYLAGAEKRGIFPLTRLDGDYPSAFRTKRGGDAPPVFFCAGNRALLQNPCVAVVGARRLTPSGAAFAAVAGMLAAKEGRTLVTGGAEGADITALEACLARGGSAVVFVPDRLTARLDLAGERVLVCSELGYDLPFTAPRALSRNACIHMLADQTLVAQSGNGTGGTWSGTAENLKHGWSEVYVNDDGSEAAAALCAMGATAVGELTSLWALEPAQQKLF